MEPVLVHRSTFPFVSVVFTTIIVGPYFWFFRETKLYPCIGLVVGGLGLIPLVAFLTRGTTTVVDAGRRAITTRRRFSGALVKEISFVGRTAVRVRAEKRSLGVNSHTMVFYFATLDGGASKAEVFWTSPSSRETLAIAEVTANAARLPLEKARDVE